MKKLNLTLFKIKTMSSLEIAELTGKEHHHVLRDIKQILAEVEIDASRFGGVYKGGNGQDRPCYNLPFRECNLIISGYSAKHRLAIIDRWQFLEDQLAVLKDGSASKKHQLEAMEALSHLLPEDLTHDEQVLNYVKANTVVNKAVSNLFGFPKLLKKNEMSPDMVEARERALDDYIKLFEIIGETSVVKDALYAMYQPKRLGVL